MRAVCTESVVSIQARPIERILKVVLLTLALLSLALTLVFGLVCLIATAILGYLLYRVIQKTDGEYDYIHTNDVFDIDLVVCNSMRKSIISVNLNQVELLTPDSSDEMMQYRELPIMDFSGGHVGQNVYAMLYTDGGKRKKLLVYLDKNMKNSLRQWMPGKVR